MLWVLSILLIFIIAAVIYVFLIMPRAVDGADTDLLICDYARRGLWSDIIPENSLAAFDRAVRAGYGIELNIRLTKDKHIVVFGNETLGRMCGVRGRIGDFTLAQIKNLRLAGTNYRIPTLVEVLHLVDGQVPLLIEIKSDGNNTEICTLASKILDDYNDAFGIESFDPFILSWFKNYRPRYARGQIVAELTKKGAKGKTLFNFARSNMLLNFYSRPDFIVVHKSSQSKISFKICAGIFRAPSFVWTVRTPKEYISAHRSGKHAIFEKIRPRAR